MLSALGRRSEEDLTSGQGGDEPVGEARAAAMLGAEVEPPEST